MKRAGGLLLVAVVLAVVAGALASLALFALAVGLILITVAAGASVAATARRLAITRSVLQHEVGEDQPISVCLQVRRPGRLPLPVHLEAQVDTDRWMPLGEGGGLVRLLVGRRGAWRLDPSRLRLRDGFGIVQWPLVVGRPEPLLVLPAPDLRLPIPPRPDARAADPDLDLDGLEPYVPGTPISRMHWPALARGAGLQQRRLTPPPGGLPLVVVDTADTSDPGAVDWAARTAAGAILRWAGTGGCRVLLPGDQAATTVTDLTAAWRGLHRCLALLQPAGPPATGLGPLEAGGAPVLRVRAAQAPAEVRGAPPRPLPPGVVAAATERWADP
jgi:uncharacterized protein (DUF58 family)